MAFNSRTWLDSYMQYRHLTWNIFTCFEERKAQSATCSISDAPGLHKLALNQDFTSFIRGFIRTASIP